jgi:hypothetical protein
MMSSGQVKVIFIGGAGRSGSTLLDRVLGRIEGFCSLGEMYHIWERGFIENQLCGCGKPFKICPFWRDVMREAFGTDGCDDGHAFLGLQRSIARLRHIPQLLFSSVRSNRFSLDLKRFITILERFYKAIAMISGCNVLIDSSKLPPHGFILSNMSGVDLYVIHLVRDSRAVVYSWQRKRIRPEIHWKESYMPRLGYAKGVYDWLLCNVLTDLLSRRVPHYKILNYEEFVRSPKKKVEELLKWLRTDAQLDCFVDESTVDLGIDHTVSGNPVRFKHGIVEIRPDMEWKANMPFVKKYVVSGVTFPFLIRYHKKGSSPRKMADVF